MYLPRHRKCSLCSSDPALAMAFEALDSVNHSCRSTASLQLRPKRTTATRAGGTTRQLTRVQP